jgi:hypothetical protein
MGLRKASRVIHIPVRCLLISVERVTNGGFSLLLVESSS